jgi:tRNA(Ile)-lysidine synthase
VVEHAAHNRGVAGSNPATATSLASRIIASLPAGPLLVALSGGPDSTALLLALREARTDLTAAHFDHALRPGSDDEARWVAALCARLGLPLISERRRHPLARGSVQAAARTARYEFLERARLAAGAGRVVLAHTADDLVEGVVLHLLRGSGLAGMRGMPARRGVFIRPMLEVWRDEVEVYLQLQGVEPLRDPSNLDRRYARVRVRLDLLPALEAARPGITRRLHRIAMLAAQRQEQVEREAALDGGTAARVEALRQMYVAAGGASPGLTRRNMQAMDRLLGSTESRRLNLPGGIVFLVENRKASMRREGRGTPRHYVLERRPCPGCEDPNAAHFKAGLDLTLGYRQPGLRIRTRAGTRKLQDLLVDAHVPRSERDTLPLVFANGRLAWVPGVAISTEFASEPGGRAEHVVLESAHRPSQGASA